MTDEIFLKAFEACEIPKEKWKHKDHIRMAWLYIKQEPHYESALRKIRIGIQKLNRSYGNTTGYHDTVTCLFALYISNAIKEAPKSETFDEFSDRNPWLYDSKDPFRKRHYSDVLWNSEIARDTFALPDLEPLPSFQST